MNQAEVTRRDQFVPVVIDTLTAFDPALCMHGDLEDGIFHGNARSDVRDSLLKNIVRTESDEAKKYDYVLVYNAATKRIEFGDELCDFEDVDQYMREDFMKEEIVLSNGSQDEVGVINRLIDPDIVSPSMSSIPDKSVLRMVEMLLKKGKTICLVIDEANEFIPQENKQVSASESVHNEALVVDLVRKLKQHENAHLILLDRANTVNGRLQREIPFHAMPASTRADVEDILRDHISPGNLSTAIALSTRTRISDLVRLVDRKGGDEEELLDSLISFRAQQIVKMGGGILESSVSGVADKEIAIQLEAREYWERLGESFLKNPDLIPNGVIIIGPPGTGKSIIPKWIASRLKVPYIKLKEIGTEGLAGRKLQKIKQALETIRSQRPCVVHIDEIDKMFPKKQDLQSNNDDEARAYLQDRISDDEFMSGVILIGTSNDPDHMDFPMLRSGRFGDMVAMMPPQTLEEKILHFKAVWHQLPSIEKNEILLPGDEFIRALVSQTPEHATGANFKAFLQECLREFLQDSSDYATFNEVLIRKISHFENRFPRDPRYKDQCEKALRMHNAFSFRENSEDDEVSTETLQMLALEAAQTGLTDGAEELQTLLQKTDKVRTDILTGAPELEALIAKKTCLLEEQEVAVDVAKKEESKLKKIVSKLQGSKKQLEKTLAGLNDEIAKRVEADTAEARSAIEEQVRERIAEEMEKVEFAETELSALRDEVQEKECDVRELIADLEARSKQLQSEAQRLQSLLSQSAYLGEEPDGLADILDTIERLLADQVAGLQQAREVQASLRSDEEQRAADFLLRVVETGQYLQQSSGAMRKILDKIADINTVRDTKGKNLLMIALDREKSDDDKQILEFANVLCERGLEVDTKDNNGRTVLMLAARNFLEVTNYLLLDQNASIDAQDKLGNTALMYASLSMNAETINFLRSHNADINKIHTSGDTALMILLKRKNDKKLLICMDAFFASHETIDVLRKALGTSDIASYYDHIYQEASKFGINLYRYCNEITSRRSIEDLSNAKEDTLLQLWDKRFHVEELPVLDLSIRDGDNESCFTIALRKLSGSKKNAYESLWRRTVHDLIDQGALEFVQADLRQLVQNNELTVIECLDKEMPIDSDVILSISSDPDLEEHLDDSMMTALDNITLA